MKKRLVDKKRVTNREAIGVTIKLGITFALLGFLGSFSASFLWHILEKHTFFTYVIGTLAILAFGGLLYYFYKTANKYL